MKKEKNKIEDIFDEVDQVNEAKKVVNKSVVGMTKPLVEEKKGSPVNSINPFQDKSKMPFVVLLIFIFLVVAGIIYLVVTGTFIESVKKTTNTVTNSVNGTNDVNNNNNRQVNQNSSLDIENINTGPLDTDSDGISDDEENKLGTLINSVDSDQDGLFDREEVYVYKTNPLVKDSDNDGQIDGVEVDAGSNPNGSGLLLDLQKEIDNL